MKKKVISFIVGLVAICLIGTAIAGTVGLTRKIDDVGNKVSSDDHFESEYFIDEAYQTGYRTFNGITYFFKVIPADTTNRYAAVTVNREVFDGYDLYVRYSYDSVSWFTAYDYSDDVFEFEISDSEPTFVT